MAQLVALKNAVFRCLESNWLLINGSRVRAPPGSLQYQALTEQNGRCFFIRSSSSRAKSPKHLKTTQYKTNNWNFSFFSGCMFFSKIRPHHYPFGNNSCITTCTNIYQTVTNASVNLFTLQSPRNDKTINTITLHS